MCIFSEFMLLWLVQWVFLQKNNGLHSLLKVWCMFYQQISEWNFHVSVNGTKLGGVNRSYYYKTTNNRWDVMESSNLFLKYFCHQHYVIQLGQQKCHYNIDVTNSILNCKTKLQIQEKSTTGNTFQFIYTALIWTIKITLNILRKRWKRTSNFESVKRFIEKGLVQLSSNSLTTSSLTRRWCWWCTSCCGCRWCTWWCNAASTYYSIICCLRL